MKQAQFLSNCTAIAKDRNGLGARSCLFGVLAKGAMDAPQAILDDFCHSLSRFNSINRIFCMDTKDLCRVLPQPRRALEKHRAALRQAEGSGRGKGKGAARGDRTDGLIPAAIIDLQGSRVVLDSLMLR